ncbi:MAG: oligopeptide ABC transporter substrate-binding protein [Tissierellia bacterium]|nr:oligopeptide ABC transporter substrate-binding protein [Tissierellia bacterium]
MKKQFRVLALLLVLVMALAACNNGGNKDAEDTKQEDQVDDNEKTDETDDDADKDDEDQAKDDDPVAAYFEQQEGLKFTHDGDPIEGGTLLVGMALDSPFVGVFEDTLYQDAFDWDMMGQTMYHTTDTGEDFKEASSGALDLDFNEADKTVTITIKDGFKWNDGTDVVAKDIVYNYEIICHPEYTGVRYDGDLQNVVGAEEYHSGEADTISGITTPDDKTVVVQFKEFYPGILWGAGLWLNPINYEYVKDVPVKDLAESDQVRKAPMSTGPFVLDKLVEGESVEWVANEHFWGGAPKIERIRMEVVPSANVLASLKAGKYDLITSMPASIMDELDDLKGYTVFEKPELAYNYTAFKLGKWDDDAKRNVLDPDAKMSDVKLRQAIAMAVDYDAIGQEFYKGLRTRGSSLIIPAFVNLHNFEADSYTYDPERAKELLDEAGYVDVDGDGFREDPNGEPFVINYASMAGGETAEPISQFEIQSWEEVGLKVELATGRLIEFQAFYDKVQNDDPEIDMYSAAWGTGSNPDPNGLYSEVAFFNMSRFVDDELTDALDRIASPDSMDDDFREQAYKDFDKVMFENCPVFPTFYRNKKEVINKRVKYWDASFQLGDNEDFRWNELELTADAPLTE